MSSGAATVILFIPVVLWAIVVQLWLVSVCYRKGRSTAARLGLAGLVVPGLFVFSLVGAARLAPPSSNWATMHYGDSFMGRAARRFPDDHDVAIGFSLPRVERSPWERVIVGGLIATVVIMVALFNRTDHTGVVSILLLIDLTMVSWLAEVELTARAYTSRTVPATVPDPVPSPTLR